MLPLVEHPNVLGLLAHFTFEGPFGNHSTLVYPLAGTDVRPDVPGARVGLEVAKLVARGALAALAHIHSREIVHGDMY